MLTMREVGEGSEGERGHGVAPAGVLRSPSSATPEESRHLNDLIDPALTKNISDREFVRNQNLRIRDRGRDPERHQQGVLVPGAKKLI